MRCPFCGSTNDGVIDARRVEHVSAMRRLRECLDCRKRYITLELPYIREKEERNVDGKKRELPRS